MCLVTRGYLYGLTAAGLALKIITEKLRKN